MSQTSHIPVLLAEVLDALNARAGGEFIDGTFGAGGYARGILNASPKSAVIGFDRDPDVRRCAFQMEEEYRGRFSFVQDCFGRMGQHVESPVDGIVLDLGVSSMQIDMPERGFSFRFDGPLDMRMDKKGRSAKDIVNGSSERDIADILFKYGEEKASRRIAHAIVAARQQTPLTTTKQLADVIHSVMPKPPDGSDSATRSFQALRIAVNDELGELERALQASAHLLKPGGRLVVVSFHSLEDRIVKNFLIQNSKERPHENRHAPAAPPPPPNFRIITKRPVTAGDEEWTLNPRAHAAKMRVAERMREDA